MLLALVASLSLAGCGGGGGASDGVDVRISAHSPSILEAHAFEGMGYSVSLNAQLAGDLSDLDGKQLYLFVEVSGDVLQGQPEVLVTDDGSAVVSVGSALDESTAAGVHEGTVRISACLDSACNSQLGNSPLTVPYKVTIEPGLRLSTQAVERDVTFGTKPPAGRVSIELPRGATEWSVSDSTSYDGSYSVTKAIDGSAAVDVVFSLKAPGSYTETFFVNTVAPGFDSSGTLLGFQQAFTVTYTVREDGSVGPVAFDPQEGVWSFPEGTEQQGHEDFLVVAQSGTLEFMGAVYFSAPVEAAGHPQVNDWIWADGMPANSYGVLPCDKAGPSLENCLPPGEYRGAVRFRHTSPTGVITDADYPIALTIL
jgi:hypothetical protein